MRIIWQNRPLVAFSSSVQAARSVRLAAGRTRCAIIRPLPRTSLQELVLLDQRAAGRRAGASPSVGGVLDQASRPRARAASRARPPWPGCSCRRSSRARPRGSMRSNSSVEDPFLAHADRADRHEAARERLRQQHQVGLDAPVLDRPGTGRCGRARSAPRRRRTARRAAGTAAPPRAGSRRPATFTPWPWIGSTMKAATSLPASARSSAARSLNGTRRQSRQQRPEALAEDARRRSATARPWSGRGRRARSTRARRGRSRRGRT